jgi:phosphoribosylformylglycinamidine synthase
LRQIKAPRDMAADLRALLASPNLCSKRWVYEQYDSMVQTNTVQGPGGEAGVMRIKDTPRALAMALDGKERWSYLDPRLGAAHAVAEAARKVACTGAVPVAATNCLNFGNPEKPEIMAQLSSAIDGLAEACTALGTPITGGNVSLYNETRGEAIDPTPVVGIVGILEDVTKAVPADFQRVGDIVLVLAASAAASGDTDLQCFGPSEHAQALLHAFWGRPPALDLTAEARLHQSLAAMATAGLLHSARDVSTGGLAVALAEGGFRRQLGVQMVLIAQDKQVGQNGQNEADLLALFGEGASRVVVTCAPGSVAQVEAMAAQHGLAIAGRGTTVHDTLEVQADGRTLLTASMADLYPDWSQALESTLR